MRHIRDSNPRSTTNTLLAEVVTGLTTLVVVSHWVPPCKMPKNDTNVLSHHFCNDDGMPTDCTGMLFVRGDVQSATFGLMGGATNTKLIRQ